MSATRFAISYSAPLMPLLTVVGMGPKHTGVEVGASDLNIWMGAKGWSFRAEIPRANIRSVEPSTAPVTGWGVHGFRGRWLVNGSSKGLVALTIDPQARAHTLGVPVTLRVLRLSLNEPDDFIAALSKNSDSPPAT